MRPKRQMLAVAAVVLALIGAGCGDGDDAVASSVSSGAAASSADDVIFGSGEFPETIPDGFPLPAGSSVGSTMIVTKTGFTEVVVRVGAGIGVTAEFFDQSLGQAGFSVDSSAAAGEAWVIEFSIDGSKGTIDITEPLEGVSQAVVRYNVP